jgi:hypothetical protein
MPCDSPAPESRAVRRRVACTVVARALATASGSPSRGRDLPEHPGKKLLRRIRVEEGERNESAPMIGRALRARACRARTFSRVRERSRKQGSSRSIARARVLDASVWLRMQANVCEHVVRTRAGESTR